MSVRVDNSYMYKYLEEQHQRDVAKTASDQADSRRKEIPYVLAKYGGIAAIILSIGLAIYFANSFKQISTNTNITQAQEQASKNQYLSETDELIDIDTLLSEMKTEPKTSSPSSERLKEEISELETEPKFPEPILEPVAEQVSVRNYVIFDQIEFVHEGINKITIGRRYDEPESEVSTSWCYVDKFNSEGFKNPLYLVNIDEERIELDITDEIAGSFGVNKSVLVEAQQLCTI